MLTYSTTEGRECQDAGLSWAKDVKPYAEKVVAAIREHSDGIILIGSPTWSQDIHLPAADPVEGENLMYTLHFYAGTHGKELQERLENALADGLPSLAQLTFPLGSLQIS